MKKKENNLEIIEISMDWSQNNSDLLILDGAGEYISEQKIMGQLEKNPILSTLRLQNLKTGELYLGDYEHLHTIIVENSKVDSLCGNDTHMQKISIKRSYVGELNCFKFVNYIRVKNARIETSQSQIDSFDFDFEETEYKFGDASLITLNWTPTHHLKITLGDIENMGKPVRIYCDVDVCIDYKGPFAQIYNYSNAPHNVGNFTLLE